MSEWISVEKRLPEDKQNVLAFFAHSNVFIARYVGGRQFHDFFKNWVPVSYWMPLPDPPQKRDTSKVFVKKPKPKPTLTKGEARPLEEQ